MSHAGNALQRSLERYVHVCVVTMGAKGNDSDAVQPPIDPVQTPISLDDVHIVSDISAECATQQM